MIDRMAEDNVVLAHYGYGCTDAADGAVLPSVFNAATEYWSLMAVKMRFVAEQDGVIENVGGKKIVPTHIESAFGCEPLPPMCAIAVVWSVEIAIPPPSLEQKSQRLQVRRKRSEWMTF